jgi:MraZ protein
MLIGEYHTQIGDKNRIALPKKLREQLEGKVIITRGYEKCLILIDNKRWDTVIGEIDKRPLLALNVRDTKRFLLGGATEIEYDNQGRFVIPEPLKTFSDITEKVVFLGIGQWIEIWSEEKWNAKLEDLSSKVADIAERLGS